MSADQRARALHDAHQDEVNRLHLLRKHEQVLRAREHARVVRQVTQQPAHAFRTPIVNRFDSNVVVDHMLAPGEPDDTGFSDGIA
jgi:hypothetical protein